MTQEMYRKYIEYLLINITISFLLILCRKIRKAF